MAGTCIILIYIKPIKGKNINCISNILTVVIYTGIELIVCDMAAVYIWSSDGSVVSFQKTAVAVLAPVVVFLKTTVVNSSTTALQP